MSAFIVSKRHIDLIVTAAIDAKVIQPSEAHETGRMLWRENLRSVAYRYPDDQDGERPGPIDFLDADVDNYTWERAGALTGNALRKTIACLEYQSCEHPDYKTSEAAKLLSRLKPAEDRSRKGQALEASTPWGW